MNRAGVAICVGTLTLALSAESAFASSLDRGKLAERLERLARRAGGASGVEVRDLEAGRELFAWRSERRRVLASNTKLFTTAAALDRFGAGHRFRTAVYADRPISRVIAGDIYLVGGGDPTLGGFKLVRAGIPRTSIKPLAMAIRQAGVRRIKGRVIADDTIFDRIRGVPYSNWGATDELRGPLSGLTYNTGWAEGDPAIAAAKALRRKLNSAGVRISGVKLGRLPSGGRTTLLGKVRSPRLARILAQINRNSDNTFAEMLLKRIAAGGNRQGSTKGGAAIAERFAQSVGSGVKMADGSGLSSGNRATPAAVASLLETMPDQRDFRSFWNSLPKVGIQGTVSDRMRGTVAEGRCRAKTGTIDGVTTLSGYCRAKAGGRLLAFSILMNEIEIERGRTYQDRMVKSIARYRP